MTKQANSDIISNVDCRRCNHTGPVCAGVAELADVLDLGSSVARRMSSSLFARTNPNAICGSSSVGRAPPCQGGGRESESRLPLQSIETCGCNSMVEFQPSKLATWVRFPSPAPKVCGSSSVGRAPPCQGGGRESESRLPLQSIETCGCNSMVEFQPSKLATWVRFPSPAPKVCGSSSVGRAPPCQGGGRESESRLPLHMHL